MGKKKIRILIADDDETALMLLTRGLESPQFEIETVMSGEEALAKLEKGKYDILLSDIGMPAPSGLELTKIVREKHPATDVMIITAYTTMDTVVQALEAGAYDFMTKPFDLSLLKAALRRCIQKRDLQAKVAAGGGKGEAKHQPEPEAPAPLENGMLEGVKDIASRVADLRSKVSATEFGDDHQSCGDFARGMLEDLEKRFKDLGL